MLTFPLSARPGGVLERPGHTEANVDLMRLAGLKPHGVLCELTNPDGTMARLPEIATFAEAHHMTVVTVNDLIQYRRKLNKQ
jgi:3,4-dihydroxy 2-butanone 4-phosphate synthase